MLEFYELITTYYVYLFEKAPTNRTRNQRTPTSATLFMTLKCIPIWGFQAVLKNHITNLNSQDAFCTRVLASLLSSQYISHQDHYELKLRQCWNSSTNRGREKGSRSVQCHIFVQISFAQPKLATTQQNFYVLGMQVSVAFWKGRTAVENHEKSLFLNKVNSPFVTNISS